MKSTLCSFVTTLGFWLGAGVALYCLDVWGWQSRRLSLQQPPQTYTSRAGRLARCPCWPPDCSPHPTDINLISRFTRCDNRDPLMRLMWLADPNASKFVDVGCNTGVEATKWLDMW